MRLALPSTDVSGMAKVRRAHLCDAHPHSPVQPLQMARACSRDASCISAGESARDRILFAAVELRQQVGAHQSVLAISGKRTPVVVLITPGSALLAACEKVVHCLDEVPTVKAADLRTASTVIAEWRPFAVVIPEPVFAFDPAEFESLARAVGAQVMVVEAQDAATALVGRLFPKLREALAWWVSHRS